MSAFSIPPAVPLQDIICKPTRPCAACLELACAFPPDAGLNGACTTVADLSRHGLHSSLFTPSKRFAVRLIFEAAMEAVEARGHGNAAVRRAFNHPVQERFRASA